MNLLNKNEFKSVLDEIKLLNDLRDQLIKELFLSGKLNNIFKENLKFLDMILAYILMVNAIRNPSSDYNQGDENVIIDFGDKDITKSIFKELFGNDYENYYNKFCQYIDDDFEIYDLTNIGFHYENYYFDLMEEEVDYDSFICWFSYVPKYTYIDNLVMQILKENIEIVKEQFSHITEEE